ncbi:MAG: PilZ domain-containing protein [Betaproteobacteria bacterium]|nr:PilZ domain-containing protein [Betaproteobacteria bacterium]
MSERRQVSRQRSFLRGLVYLGNSPSAINCLVRDISDTGARLTFSSPIAASETLELHIPVKGQTLRSKVKWRENNEIGIAFISDAGVGVQPASDDELAVRVERLEGEIAALKQMIKRLQRATHITDAA